MRKIQVYIEGKRLELFNDEQIQITSSVQNVQDIAKVFTDFSQSFTVPASTVNNEIFKHFYQTDIDTTLDYQIRRTAKIEIDLVTFRTGKIQLEKANIKKGMPESYTLTFYGDVRTLQDYFGDDKLNVLDYSPYSHTYSGAEVEARITNTTDYDVRYPLISSERVWTYNDSSSTDITKTSTRLNYYELFPALKVRRIFDAIETKYSIDFVGAFLSDERFDKAFLYLKASELFEFQTEAQRIDFNTYSSFSPNVWDNVNDTLHYEYRDTAHPGIVDVNVVSGSHTVQVRIYDASNPAITYFIDVYKNNTLYTTITGNGDATYTIITENNEVGLDSTYYFTIRANSSLVFRSNIYYNFAYTYYNDILGVPVLTSGLELNIANGVAQTLIGNIDISSNIPDMTIADFVKGVLKDFNLTIAPLSANTFELLPLEDWYAKGRIIDITKHTDIDSIDIERVKLYKRISFKYQKSESFINTGFADTYGREYGDLEQTYDYDGAEYVIESPFENVRPYKFENTDLQVSYLIDRNYGKYIPKPMLLYMAEQTPCDFKLNNASSVVTISNYMPFGQDTFANGQYFSLNFGPEVSSLREIVINNHLYNTYYSNYINNLYVKKNRLVYVKCYLPLSILASIRLNDRVIIRDKRYIINEMKSNLTTGEVDLTLLLDFRTIIRNKPKLIVPQGGLTLKAPIILQNECYEAHIDVGTTGITAYPTIITEDTNVEFTIPTNTDEGYFLITEDGNSLDTEDFYNLISEEGNTVVLPVEVSYFYLNGAIEIETYPFIQSGL